MKMLVDGVSIEGTPEEIQALLLARGPQRMVIVEAAKRPVLEARHYVPSAKKAATEDDPLLSWALHRNHLAMKRTRGDGHKWSEAEVTRLVRFYEKNFMRKRVWRNDELVRSLGMSSSLICSKVQTLHLLPKLKAMRMTGSIKQKHHLRLSPEGREKLLKNLEKGRAALKAKREAAKHEAPMMRIHPLVPVDPAVQGLRSATIEPDSFPTFDLKPEAAAMLREMLDRQTRVPSSRLTFYNTAPTLGIEGLKEWHDLVRAIAKATVRLCAHFQARGEFVIEQENGWTITFRGVKR